MRFNGTELVDARSQVWDDNTLSWVPERQAVVSTDTLNVTLPATAATAAKQDTGNASLASILAAVGSLATRFDGTSSPLLYLGTAQPGTSSSSAAWQIQRIDVTSGVVFAYADGNANFDNVWDNRASLSYS